MNALGADRHHELAAFLRSRRARVSPEQVGLPRGSRRRTPGLRREEVALLANISLEWYGRLEQGRDIHASTHVLESLATVLQLDANERAYLFLLASNPSPTIEAFSPPIIGPNVHQLLDQLGTIPTCAVDARLTIVAWNPAFSAVFGDFATLSERERNMIWRLFTIPWQRRGNEEWKALARAAVGHFRAAYAHFINDPWWAKQIGELSRISPEFRELWACHDVFNGSEGHKSMHHPLVGELTFDFLALQTVASRDLQLMMYTPRSRSGTAEKIEQLLTAAEVGPV